MEKSSFKALQNASMSLSAALHRKSKKLPPTLAMMSTGFHQSVPEIVRKEDLVSVLVESRDVQKVLNQVGRLGTDEHINPLSNSVISAKVSLTTAAELVKHADVGRVQTKKDYQLHLDAVPMEVDLVGAGGHRLVTESGKDVFIGIIDSGFDLSHPMFRDAAGKLRVAGLLDQTVSPTREFTTAQLETGWSNGTNPGADENGHGTHVASIAGGSQHDGLEGIAPDARFLLVKTNFQDTADGVQWIFSKSGTKPCVINMSLGTHLGAHDGSSVEELLIDQLSGPGKIVVISAGNERERNLHIGRRFLPNESQQLTFDVARNTSILTLWYAPQDTFSMALVTPSGQELPVPNIGMNDQYSSSAVAIDIGRQTYIPSNLIQTQIAVSFRNNNPAIRSGWGIRMTCNSAVTGRLDGWFANTGFGEFRPHPLIEQTRTVGMAATCRSCIAVASHVSKNQWQSDDGPQQDLMVSAGRSSPFSSQGPTRDGRQKPDISAPGQYVTAALASQSELAAWGERADSPKRLLSIEGTSMAAPVVTGIVALMLQKKKTLKPDQIRQILADTAKNDGHIGTIGWNPAFGHGKVDVKKAIDSI